MKDERLKMKDEGIYRWWRVCFVLSAILLVGCGKQSTASSDMTGTDTMAADTMGISMENLDSAKSRQMRDGLLKTDSFKYALKTASGSCEVYIDYPKSGRKDVVESLRTFIRSTLFENGGDTIADDPSEWVRLYCINRQRHLSKTLSEMGLQQVNEAYAPEEGIDIRLTCLTERFATYEVYRYSYISHGAHGEYSDYGVTFRLSDGRRLDNILNKVDEALYAHIRVGLREYFGVSSDKALDEICTADLSLMPMPTFPAYLMRDGVRLHYSIYDICAFDDGDPEGTIPDDIAWPYLSEAAKECLGGIKDEG